MNGSEFLSTIYLMMVAATMIIGTACALIAIFSDGITPESTKKGKHIYWFGFGFTVACVAIVVGGMVIGFAMQISGFGK